AQLSGRRTHAPAHHRLLPAAHLPRLHLKQGGSLLGAGALRPAAFVGRAEGSAGERHLRCPGRHHPRRHPPRRHGGHGQFRPGSADRLRNPRWHLAHQPLPAGTPAAAVPAAALPRPLAGPRLQPRQHDHRRARRLGGAAAAAGGQPALPIRPGPIVEDPLHPHQWRPPRRQRPVRGERLMAGSTVTAFALLVAGLIMLTGGFVMRAGKAGVYVMLIGIVLVLAGVAYYILVVISAVLRPTICGTAPARAGTTPRQSRPAPAAAATPSRTLHRGTGWPRTGRCNA